MIKFSLKCAEEHLFDSWFQSSGAFDALQKSSMLVCPVCGSSSVEKALMAPRVQPGNDTPSLPNAKPLSTPQGAAELAMAELRRKIETESEYVGVRFAKEARDMHDGLTPERPIYGEARPEDAKMLIEDGIPVSPLPFTPSRRTN